MKCLTCQGRMDKATAPFHIGRKGYHLTLNAVSAWICQQCGEAYFDEREVASIQEVIDLLDRQTQRLASFV